MEDTIITTYYLCEEFLKAVVGHRDDPEVRLSTAEVMTIPRPYLLWPAPSSRQPRGEPIVFGRVRLHQEGDLQESLQPPAARHRPLPLANALRCVGRSLQARALRTDLCGGLLAGRRVRQIVRIRRCKLYPPEEHGEAFRGYIVSKRRYFYGLRVHLVISGRGEPVEFSLAAASETDVKLLKEELGLDLPEGSIIHADKGYSPTTTTRTC